MEEDILNYLPTVMFRGTPCIYIFTYTYIQWGPFEKILTTIERFIVSYIQYLYTVGPIKLCKRKTTPHRCTFEYPSWANLSYFGLYRQFTITKAAEECETAVKLIYYDFRLPNNYETHTVITNCSVVHRAILLKGSVRKK